jgi:hypothetical protein
MNFYTLNAIAQGIVGGEIMVIDASIGLTLVDVHIYSENDYKDQVIVHWGDGTSDTLHAPSVASIGNIYRSVFHHYHFYPDSGIYVITVMDSFWVSDISNIANSSEAYLFLQDSLHIDAVIPDQGPEFIGTQLNIYYFDEGALYHDINLFYFGINDEFRFKVVPVPVSDYSFPEAENFIGFEDVNSGRFIWDKPAQLGRYAIALKVEGWRLGRKVSTTTRQMVIQVDSIFSGLGYTPLGGDLFNSFPNPASQQLILNFSRPPPNPLHVTLKNLLGAILIQQTVPANSQRFEVDVSSLAAGLYFIEVASGDERWVRRFVKE